MNIERQFDQLFWLKKATNHLKINILLLRYHNVQLCEHQH